MTPGRQVQRRGVAAALLAAVFLGSAPIFGKQAYGFGITPLSLAAWRTLLAAGGLWLIYLIVGRKYIYIYPVGLIGCFAAGAVNGLGSLLYYTGLQRVDAGVGQLVYSLYPVFLVMLLRLDGHRFSGLTLVRVILGIIAVSFLTQTGDGPADLSGLGMMLGAGLAYAVHLTISQRVSYEMPAQTLTLYTLTSMAVVVCAANLLAGWTPVPAAAWQPTFGLALVTVSSRMGMFLGVKRLGSLQTALIGITEILVTLLLAHALLNEALSPRQWIGAGILISSLLLIGREPTHGGSLVQRKPRAGKPLPSTHSSIVIE
jgi:drug/metabolite transporter (DMT)-like permease